MSSSYAQKRGGWGSAYNRQPGPPSAKSGGGYGSAYAQPRPTYTGGRTTYDGQHAVVGQRPTYTGAPFRAGRGGPVPGTSPSGSHSHGVGGFFHRLGSDLVNVAEQAPAGFVKVAKATYDQAVHGEGSPLHHKGDKNSPLLDVAAGSAKQIKSDLRHPLRHPGYTLLDVLPAAGVAGKVAEAGAVAKAGGTAGEIARAAVRGTPGPRVLKVGDLEARGHYSRAAGSRVIQKASDAVLQKGATKPGRLGVTAENRLHSRAAKFNQRNESVADAVARTPGTVVSELGKKLRPEELRALRLVAEETPVERRVAAQTLRMSGAKTAAEQTRHQERIDLTHAASKFLTSDEHGRPVFKPGATKLQKVYDALAAASRDREHMLAHLDLFDEGAQQAAKTKVAQVAAGGTYEKPTPAKAGISPALDAATAERDRLAVLHERALGQEEKWHVANASRDLGALSEADAQARLDVLDRHHAALVKKLIPETSPYGREAQQRETAYRNAASAKPRARKTATVKAEESQIADSKLREVVANNPDHPAAKTAAAILEERDQLRAALNARAESAFAGDEPKPLPSAPASAHASVPRASNPYRNRIVQIGTRLEAAQQKVERLTAAAQKRVKPTGIVGAEDITASPDATFIGNPVERGKFSGKPKVSSTGTFGHTAKPSSLKVSTGSSVEHALERNDVTNIVAERHHEAVRLAKVDRVVQNIAKKAGEAAPRRKDDVWVWTDKTVASSRIPKEVRQYLDNPESLQRLAPDRQLSVVQKLKDATMQKEDWRDPEKVAEFKKLAAQGKGVFVPRRLLGEAAKRDYMLGELPGIRFVDAVNNAQKAGLVYLKLNYPVVQGLSNVAMNIVHQGFATPVRLTQAVKLSKAIGTEYAAVIDDIMGQGAVLQAQFEGQGVIAKASQKIAHVMSNKVDTPSRRAAFLHEAAKAGYDTPEKLVRLLTSDKAAGDLGEVSQRAKEAIVDYGDLSPAERSIVRRLVFVYPWQKGATKYAAHFMRDHPVQAAAVGQAGAIGQAQSDQTLGAVPTYLRGAFDVGGGLVNPAGFNFFQTPAQIGEALAGAATGNPAQAGALQGFLGPAPGVGVGLLTGHDDIGRPLKGNLAANVRDLTFKQTPAAQIARAALGKYDVVRKGTGRPSTSATFPNKHDVYWRFLLGGLYPRHYDVAALNKNAGLQKTGR